MEEHKLQQIHDQFIKNQPDGAAVILEIFTLANLTEQVQQHLGLSVGKVHIKTKILKHMYERRPASIYDFLLMHLSEIIRFPERIYQNQEAKKGQFIFAKQFPEGLFMASIETNAHPETGQEIHVLITAFKVEQRYLNKYKLIWSWEDGDASS